MLYRKPSLFCTLYFYYLAFLRLKETRGKSKTCVYVSSFYNSTGDVAEAVRHARTIRAQIRRAQGMDKAELHNYAKELRVSFDLLQKTAEIGRLPVVNFAAGGLGKTFKVHFIVSGKVVS